MTETLLWLSFLTFSVLLLASLYIYFQANRFDERYLEKIEKVRHIKSRRFVALVRKAVEEERGGTGGESKDGNSEDVRKGIGLESDKRLNEIGRSASSMQLWFDYPLMAKEFLIGTSFWLFILGYAIVQVSLIVYFETAYLGSYHSSYLASIWLICIYKVYNSFSQYVIVVRSIDRHIALLREGNLGEL